MQRKENGWLNKDSHYCNNQSIRGNAFRIPSNTIHWVRMYKKWIDPDGYVRIWDKKKGRSLGEHRKIFEEYNKCCLLKWTLIHHRNHIRTDNRIENLEPMSFSIHTHNHRKETPWPNYWKGKHLTKETKAKLRAKAILRIPWNKGKKIEQPPWNKGKKGLQIMSEEAKLKMSVRVKQDWKNGVFNHRPNPSEETKRKMSESHKKRLRKDCDNGYN